MKVSTITSDQIIPEATKAVKRFVKGGSYSRTLRYFGTHYTLDDLVMDAVEKVVRANPMYLTKSYVWIAARCVCLDLMNRKKLQHVTITPDDDEDETPIEELMEGDIYDHTSDTHQYITSALNEVQQELLKKLLEGKMYADIAKELGISLRTLERQIQELKWTIEFLLTEQDPDTNTHSLLF